MKFPKTLVFEGKLNKEITIRVNYDDVEKTKVKKGEKVTVFNPMDLSRLFAYGFYEVKTTEVNTKEAKKEDKKTEKKAKKEDKNDSKTKKNDK